MAIDRCLITAAGMGTRMGPIGRVLPKILWPVFDTTLLALQVHYAQQLGAKEIYLNGHFLSDQVREYIDQNGLPVTYVHEETLLDVGGAIYNIANLPEVNYRGNLLVLNGDQFLFFDPALFNRAEALLAKNDGVLFGISVDSAAGYRQTIIKDNHLVDITPPLAEGPAYQTYSGVSIFNLEKIERKQGIQPFFDSIANYRQRSLAFIPLKDYSYWDFGTTNRYRTSLYQCLAQLESPMAKLLDQSCGWNRSAIGPESYRAAAGIINMGKHSVASSDGVKAIILANDEKNALPLKKGGIYYYELVDVLE